GPLAAATGHAADGYHHEVLRPAAYRTRAGRANRDRCGDRGGQPAGFRSRCRVNGGSGDDRRVAVLLVDLDDFKRSTTPRVMPRVTRCCGQWRECSPERSATVTSSPASAATSSACCCPAPGPARRTWWPTGWSRRSAPSPTSPSAS